ncbi:hypothetical protein [Mycobacteroides salmoniphilum]|uniref:Uncharacterized protein n=1 Tax=Mycobacteroides salmoniphilum TaxID=404941 RepID=A0A4R8SG30_9MYCO|nr:hypothetical protein [Mycobacteroides salmoniphilum]TDZ95866.1 hypothetical protein CCUG60885_02003 [Mycobacteroides salmoniphilum]TEA04963.1 hypothetical protein CCUG60883_02262 [Mycobacteroides salmoniphilum]
MDVELINQAIVTSIQDSAIPRVDLQKLIDRYGQDDGANLGDRVIGIVQEAVAMPIDWGTKTLVEGVNDIMGRFSEKHPELSPDALAEIGRCVGWQLR